MSDAVTRSDNGRTSLKGRFRSRRTERRAALQAKPRNRRARQEVSDRQRPSRPKLPHSLTTAVRDEDESLLSYRWLACAGYIGEFRCTRYRARVPEPIANTIRQPADTEQKVMHRNLWNSGRGHARFHADLRGRPPRLPFSRDAAAFNAVSFRPPAEPNRAAIQRLDPNRPSSNAGT